MQLVLVYLYCEKWELTLFQIVELLRSSILIFLRLILPRPHLDPCRTSRLILKNIMWYINNTSCGRSQYIFDNTCQYIVILLNILHYIINVHFDNRLVIYTDMYLDLKYYCIYYLMDIYVLCMRNINNCNCCHYIKTI